MPIKDLKELGFGFDAKQIVPRKLPESLREALIAIMIICNKAVEKNDLKWHLPLEMWAMIVQLILPMPIVEYTVNTTPQLSDLPGGVLDAMAVSMPPLSVLKLTENSLSSAEQIQITDREERVVFDISLTVFKPLFGLILADMPGGLDGGCHMDIVKLRVPPIVQLLHSRFLWRCNDLEEVHIPASVVKIMEGAFSTENCLKLKQITCDTSEVAKLVLASGFEGQIVCLESQAAAASDDVGSAFSP